MEPEDSTELARSCYQSANTTTFVVPQLTFCLRRSHNKTENKTPINIAGDYVCV